jgi:hypothetical protein
MTDREAQHAAERGYLHVLGERPPFFALAAL